MVLKKMVRVDQLQTDGVISSFEKSRLGFIRPASTLTLGSACNTGGGGGGGGGGLQLAHARPTVQCILPVTSAWSGLLCFQLKPTHLTYTRSKKSMKIDRNEGTPVFEIIVGLANLLTINLGTHRSRPLMQTARLSVVCDFD